MTDLKDLLNKIENLVKSKDEMVEQISTKLKDTEFKLDESKQLNRQLKDELDKCQTKLKKLNDLFKEVK